MRKHIRLAALLAAGALALSLLSGCGGQGGSNGESAGSAGQADSGSSTGVAAGASDADAGGDVIASDLNSLTAPVQNGDGLDCHGVGLRLTAWDPPQPLGLQVLPHNYEGDFAGVFFHLMDEAAGYPEVAELIALPHETQDQAALSLRSAIEEFDMPVELLMSENGFDYYLLVIDPSGVDFPDEQTAEAYEQAAAYLQNLKEHVQAIPMVSYEAPTELHDLTFSTTDLDGDPVTEAIFGQADVTILHVWGTFCTPCIEEMPQWAEWLSGPQTDGIQTVFLVTDLNSLEDTATLEDAEYILESSGITDAVNLVANAELSATLAPFIEGVPVTMLFDPAGNMIAGPILGSGRLQEIVETAKQLAQ